MTVLIRLQDNTMSSAFLILPGITGDEADG
jgi:hypothetical protein